MKPTPPRSVTEDAEGASPAEAVRSATVFAGVHFAYGVTVGLLLGILLGFAVGVS